MITSGGFGAAFDILGPIFGQASGIEAMPGSAAQTIVGNPRTMLNRPVCWLSVLAEARSTATGATGAS